MVSVSVLAGITRSTSHNPFNFCGRLQSKYLFNISFMNRGSTVYLVISVDMQNYNIYCFVDCYCYVVEDMAPCRGDEA